MLSIGLIRHPHVAGLQAERCLLRHPRGAARAL